MLKEPYAQMSTGLLSPSAFLACMKRLITGDGSVTFFSDSYQETYHSVSGAMEEAFRKFVGPTNLKTRALEGKLRVLDICFGLGYKSLAAIHSARKANPDCRIELVALEKDINIVETQVDVPVACSQDYALLRGLVKKSLGHGNEAQEQNLSFKLVIGDARQTIRKLKGDFDLVFLDPFSPRKNPELWTKQFFRQIHMLMSDDAYMTTYSCASIVRKNLKEVGFEVKDGPSVGRRSPSTVALKRALV